MPFRRSTRVNLLRYAGLLALLSPFASSWAGCAVSRLALDDPSRSTGLPCTSPGDRGNPDMQLHALLWMPASPAYAKAGTYLEVIDPCR
jgi:hypothetical protein